jgi:hypothetical protein
MSQSITKVLSKILTVIFTLALVATSLPVNAAESKNSIDDLKKIQNNIREKDPQKIQSEKLEKKSKDIQVSKQKDLDIEIDSNSKKVTVKNLKKGNTTIGIPNGDQLTDVQTIDNQVVFSNKNAKFDVIAEAIDGGMRQVINIKDSSAPTVYDFPVSLEDGEKLIVNEDGSAMVTKPIIQEEKDKRIELAKTAPAGVKIPDYDTKALIGKPWAKDANGKELKTFYSVIGSNLRQTIETKDAVFPVTADPIYCSSYTNSALMKFKFITDPSYNRWAWSDEVIPSSCTRTYFWSLARTLAFHQIIGLAEFGVTSWNAWNDTYSKTGNWGYSLQDGKWYYAWDKQDNYWGMYNQYMCHLVNPQTVDKDSYNLEPGRIDPGLFGTYQKGCNPVFK